MHDAFEFSVKLKGVEGGRAGRPRHALHAFEFSVKLLSKVGWRAGGWVPGVDSNSIKIPKKPNNNNADLLLDGDTLTIVRACEYVAEPPMPELFAHGDV